MNTRQIIATFMLAAAPLWAPALAGAQSPGPELPPQEVSASSGNTAWRPTQAQARRLVKETDDYFAAKDAHRFVDAYAFFSPVQKKTVPFDGWSAQLVKFYDKAGAFEGRRIRKITWYKDPPDEKPGIYVATDFTGEFHNLALHCGYLAWHQQMDGSFELVREESNTIEKSIAAKMTPEMMRVAHANFKC